MSKVFVVKISLPEPIEFTVEAESEDEEFSKAEFCEPWKKATSLSRRSSGNPPFDVH